MKNFFLLLCLIILSFCGLAQAPKFPIPQSVANNDSAIGISNAFRTRNGFVNGVFQDTAAANLTHIRQYSGAQIFTSDVEGTWIRNTATTRWLFQFNTGDSSLSILQTIFNNSIVNVFNLNDSTLIICTGAGSCDTISVGGTNNTYFINDSTLVSCDTTQEICVGDSCYTTTLCDTITITRQSLFLYQNGLNQPFPGIVEFGSNDAQPWTFLQHNTDLNTFYYNLKVKGNPVWNAVTDFEQRQTWGISNEIVGFKSVGSGIDTAIDINNNVKLRVQYTGKSFGSGAIPAVDTGYMGNKIGYFIGTNTATAGSFGQRIDDERSKLSGMFLHTLDTTMPDVITFYGSRPLLTTLYGPLQSDITLSSKRIMTLNYDQSARWYGYPNTRNDGATNTVLYTDVNGNMKHGPVVAGSSITIINDTTINICSFGTNLCDTFIINNIGVIQTVTILNDSTLLVCDSVGVCDTLSIPQTSFVESPLIFQNTLWVAKNGNDAQGVRNRADKPFLTIRAAEAAAQFDDAIVVMPGTYIENDTIPLNKSVSFKFIGEGEVLLNTALASGILFYDYNFASVNKIDAPGWTFTGRLNQTPFRKHGIGSYMVLDADAITSVTNPAIDFYEGYSEIKANNIYTSNSFAAVYFIEERADVEANRIQVATTGSGVYFEDCPYLSIQANQILQDSANGDYHVYGAATNPGDSVFITADLIRGGTEWPLYIVGDATEVYVTVKKITAKTDCVVVSGTDQMTVTAEEIESTLSTDTDGIVHAEAGNLLVIGAKLSRHPAATGYDLLASLGGNLTLSGVSYDQTRVNITGASSIRRIDSLWYGTQLRLTNARLEEDSANIASANDLTLGRANFNVVSGTTQINAITTEGWQPGSTISIEFTGALTVKHNTAGGAGTAVILLAGATDYTSAANDVLSLVFDGNSWNETARKTSAGTTVTADNGLNMSTATNVRIGGTGILHTNIDWGEFSWQNTFNSIDSSGLILSSTSTAANNNAQRVLSVSLSGANSNTTQTTAAIYATNTHTGTSATNYGIRGVVTNGLSSGAGVYGEAAADQSGVLGLSVSGNGVSGSSTSGSAGAFTSSSGSGVNAISTSSFGIVSFSSTGESANFQINPASTNTLATVARFTRLSSGTPANGIGSQIAFHPETDLTSSNPSAHIGSTWTDVANGSRTGDLQFYTTNSTVSGLALTISGNKRMTLTGRLQPVQGADVASVAGAIAVGLDGNTFELTGTNAVTLISNLNWSNGAMITFVFTSTATLTDGTANSGTDIGMELAGNANFVGSADDVITLVLSEVGGTQRWREVSRSVN